MPTHEELIGATQQSYIQQGIVPGALSITSEVLTPQVDLSKQVSTPVSQSYPNLSDYTPDMALTAPEKKQQGLYDRATQLNDILAGKSAYTTEQQVAAGIPEFEKSQRDLASQLKALQNEQLRLQNEYNYTIPNQMQLGAEGRGITAGGLAPLTASELRKNQIKQGGVASRGLFLSASIDATNGLLASAQDKVKRAVEAKYGQQEAELDAKIKNLELIRSSPETKLADANRAQKQLDIQNAKKEALGKQKTGTENTYKIALEAAKNGADALTIQNIQNAKTPSEALQIAANAGMVSGVDYTIQEINGRKVRIGFQGGKLVSRIDLGVADVEGTTLGGGRVSDTAQAIIDNPSLFDDLTPTVRGKIISELQSARYDTSNLGTKSLSDTAIKEISQTQKALDDLGGLRTTILQNTKYIGPIKGWQMLNPWSKARQVQADIDRVKQTVGKALEGGVLRKEDEEKYKKILATLLDTPETAIYKVDALLSSIQRDIEIYKSLQQTGGRSVDVRAPLQKAGEGIKIEDLRIKYNY